MIGFRNRCFSVVAKPTRRRSNESHCSQCNRPIRSSKSMPEAQLTLRPSRSCSPTLVVKLAVMAALATMLVRYRRFRHMLIFERRGVARAARLRARARHSAGGRRDRASAAELQGG